MQIFCNSLTNVAFCPLQFCPFTYLRLINTRRYFFHIAYNGLHYHGWQRQVSALGIQEVIEGVMTKVLKTPVSITGCGRTDAQVHASQYFFHADLAETFDFDLLCRLNRNLPPDIAVFDILPVHDKAHARFDATQRTYDYFIHTRKDPFLQGQQCLVCDESLDLKSMQAAVDLLPKYDDYYAFCKSPASLNTTICRVTSAHLWVDQNGRAPAFSNQRQPFSDRHDPHYCGAFAGNWRGKNARRTL